MPHLVIGNAIILLVIAAGLRQRLSPYSPLMLSAFAWLTVFVSGLIFGHRFFPVTDRVFVLWLVWFLVSCFFYFFTPGPPRAARATELRRLPFDYTPILVVLILWLAYQVQSVGNAGPVQFFLNLRLSSNQIAGFESLGLVGRFYPLVFALFLFEHVNARPANRPLRLLLWCWMLLYAFATMGKFAILTPVLAWAVVKGTRWVLPTRRLLLLAPLLVGIMALVHFVRDGSGQQLRATELLGVYTYSPIVALGYMETPPGDPLGAHIFRFVYAAAHATIGGVEPVQVIQEYVAVPDLTNVFTALQPFVIDFGWAGVLFGAVVYGLFFGLLFRAARTQEQLPLIVYAGLSVVLVGQIIGEFLFTMFSGHLQFIIAAIVVTHNSRRVDLDR